MSVAALLPSWQLAFEPAQQEPQELHHTTSVRSLATLTRDHDMPGGVEDMTPGRIRTFLVTELSSRQGTSGGCRES